MHEYDGSTALRSAPRNPLEKIINNDTKNDGKISRSEAFRLCKIANDKFIQDQKEYSKSITEIRLKCQHEWTFSSDPSGNSDSSYECDACGSSKRCLS